MQSAFDTRAASFDPEQTMALSKAYQIALRSFPSNQRVAAGMKSKLAKVIVNLGRERMRKHLDLNAEEISSKASDWINQQQA